MACRRDAAADPGRRALGLSGGQSGGLSGPRRQGAGGQPLTFKTVLIAFAAVAALIGAAMIAVPSAQEGLHLCLDLPKCLGF